MTGILQTNDKDYFLSRVRLIMHSDKGSLRENLLKYTV